MSFSSSFNRLKPALTLFILSPIVAELLGGSTPASRANQLLLEALYYGPAAILIREWARSRNKGWGTIIILALAAGLLEEGILLQSVFNAKFLGFDLSLGRTWGVNWAWSEFIIPYHAVWSFTIPIILTELLFADRKDQRWLSKGGVVFITFVFLLGCMAYAVIFYNISKFSTGWISYGVAAILIVLLGILAMSLRSIRPAINAAKNPGGFVIGIIAFITGGTWFFLLSLVFRQPAGIPAWLIQLAGLIVLILSPGLIKRFLSSGRDSIYLLSMAGGALLASELAGFFILQSSGNQGDIIFQLIFMALTVLFLFFFQKKLHKQNTV